MFGTFLYELTYFSPQKRQKIFATEIMKVFMTIVMFYFMAMVFTSWMQDLDNYL